MTLEQNAYLVVEDDTTTAEFQFSVDLEPTGELNKSYIMADRGQYIQEVVNQAPVVGDDSGKANRRAGWWVDGGAGSWSQTLQWSVGGEGIDYTWGDGSGGTGQANVTQKDASGEGVSATARKAVFELWLARTITDSNNPGRLYIGEWADGTYASSAGVMNQPIPVAVTGHTATRDPNEPGVLSGSVDVQRITPFPEVGIPSWLSGGVDDFIGEIQGAFNDIPDA